MSWREKFAPEALFDLTGKTALIVGATGSFGQTACHALGAAGARIAATGGNAEKLALLVDELRGAGMQCQGIGLRPDSEKACDAIVAATVEAFGSVDILVVASGTNDVAPIEQMDPERFVAVLNANVVSTWLIARSAGKRMIEQGKGGKVVFTSSARGKLGHPAGYTAYCTSKAAVDGLTKALGCEWGKYGITVNAIAPTVFRSSINTWMFEDDDRAKNFREGILSRIPIGRLGEPDDLAGPLLFLCSKASDFHTGHIVCPDGGYTAG